MDLRERLDAVAAGLEGSRVRTEPPRRRSGGRRARSRQLTRLRSSACFRSSIFRLDGQIGAEPDPVARAVLAANLAKPSAGQRPQ